MTDKNGIEIKTGDIVEITGSYFKTDNGFYFVERSEGDPGWLGSDYCLHKISKRGKISQAKKNICFWPIAVFISDRAKTAEARKWNQDHAEIEVKTGISRAEVADFFKEMADELTERIRRDSWNFGEESDIVKKQVNIQGYYKSVSSAILAEA